MFIEHEDGKRDCWGKEPTRDEAARVAADLELGLRLISYVSHAVDIRSEAYASPLNRMRPRIWLKRYWSRTCGNGFGVPQYKCSDDKIVMSPVSEAIFEY